MEMEIRILKMKCKVLEHTNNEKNNEVLDLTKRLETLDNNVLERVDTITTPTKRGTKKEKKSEAKCDSITCP